MKIVVGPPPLPGGGSGSFTTRVANWYSGIICGQSQSAWSMTECKVGLNEQAKNNILRCKTFQEFLRTAYTQVVVDNSKRNQTGILRSHEYL